jgi:hypothetical protein
MRFICCAHGCTILLDSVALRPTTCARTKQCRPLATEDPPEPTYKHNREGVSKCSARRYGQCSAVDVHPNDTSDTGSNRELTIARASSAVTGKTRRSRTAVFFVWSPCSLLRCVGPSGKQNTKWKVLLTKLAALQQYRTQVIH